VVGNDTYLVAFPHDPSPTRTLGPGPLVRLRGSTAPGIERWPDWSTCDTPARRRAGRSAAAVSLAAVPVAHRPSRFAEMLWRLGSARAGKVPFVCRPKCRASNIAVWLSGETTRSWDQLRAMSLCEGGAMLQRADHTKVYAASTAKRPIGEPCQHWRPGAAALIQARLAPLLVRKRWHHRPSYHPTKTCLSSRLGRSAAAAALPLRKVRTCSLKLRGASQPRTHRQGRRAITSPSAGGRATLPTGWMGPRARQPQQA